MIPHTLFLVLNPFLRIIREFRVINQVPVDAWIDTLFKKIVVIFSHMHHDFQKNEENVKTRFKSVVG